MYNIETEISNYLSKFLMTPSGIHVKARLIKPEDVSQSIFEVANQFVTVSIYYTTNTKPRMRNAITDNINISHRDSRESFNDVKKALNDIKYVDMYVVVFEHAYLEYHDFDAINSMLFKFIGGLYGMTDIYKPGDLEILRDVANGNVDLVPRAKCIIDRLIKDRGLLRRRNYNVREACMALISDFSF